MKPYTYLLKHKPTGLFYYGVRYSKDCNPEDFWVKYFTSSKSVKKLIENYGKDSFEYEIRKTFDSAEKAIMWENKVLKRLNVINNPKFLNKTNNKAFSIESCSKSNKGKRGKEHNRFGSKNPKLSEYNILNPKNGSKNGMYGKIGKDHPNYGKRGKLSPHYGKKRTDMIETVMCPHCNKSGMVAGMNRWHFSNCKKRII